MKIVDAKTTDLATENTEFTEKRRNMPEAWRF